MLTNGLFRFSDKPHTNATATIVVVVVWWSPRWHCRSRSPSVVTGAFAGRWGAIINCPARTGNAVVVRSLPGCVIGLVCTPVLSLSLSLLATLGDRSLALALSFCTRRRILFNVQQSPSFRHWSNNLWFLPKVSTLAKTGGHCFSFLASCVSFLLIWTHFLDCCPVNILINRFVLIAT